MRLSFRPEHILLVTVYPLPKHAVTVCPLLKHAVTACPLSKYGFSAPLTADRIASYVRLLGLEVCSIRPAGHLGLLPVSYTHLTLPTKRIV